MTVSKGLWQARTAAAAGAAATATATAANEQTPRNSRAFSLAYLIVRTPPRSLFERGKQAGGLNEVPGDGKEEIDRHLMKLGHTIEDSRKKYSELTEELLEKLEEWIQQRNLSDVPREQLAIFAHSCYFQMDATLRCMETYYRIRTNAPEFFSNRDIKLENLQCSLKVLEFVMLPVPDPNGYSIIVHRLADTRASKYFLNDAIKLMMMTVDENLYIDGCCPGYVFLFDMAGVNIAHLTRISIGSIRKFFEYVQEGMPIRLKVIHIINVVGFMDKILSIMKPFMNSEILEMLHLHTGDVSEIYKYIPPKCLPEDYGGELDCIEVLHGEHIRKLEQLRDYFLEEETIRQNYSTSKKKNNK
ncbi:alpha-tocopherol transfer protein-like isoform X2 [Vespula squamosa]|uniref:Alpha-tocopherol transfer protein-like isoform X2 n=1 Tax=Vespula squamosa TaxID=30214 RepID=A0ABD2A3P8_VESSQ